MDYSFFGNPEFLQQKKQLMELRKKLDFANDTLLNAQPSTPIGPEPAPQADSGGVVLTDEEIARGGYNVEVPKDMMFVGPGDKASSPVQEPAGFKGSIDKVMKFGTAAATSLSTTSKNDGDRIMGAVNLAGQGAQTGMSIAGPAGAAVGAGVGLVVGAIDGFGDIGRNNRNIRKENKNELEKQHRTLEQEGRMKDGLAPAANLRDLQKKQQNFLI